MRMPRKASEAGVAPVLPAARMGGRCSAFWRGLLEDDRQKEKGEPACRIVTVSRLSGKKMEKMKNALEFGEPATKLKEHPSKTAIHFISKHKSDFHPDDFAELVMCGLGSHEYVFEKSVKLIPSAEARHRGSLLMKVMEARGVSVNIVEMFALAEEGELRGLLEKLLSMQLVVINPVIAAVDYALRFPENERAEMIGKMIDAGGPDVMLWTIRHIEEVPAKDRAGLLKKGFEWTSPRDTTGDVLGALEAVPIEGREDVLEIAMARWKQETRAAAIGKAQLLLPEGQERIICKGLGDSDELVRKAAVDAIKLAPIEERARLIRRALWSLDKETASAAWKIRGCAPAAEIPGIMAVHAFAEAFPKVESGFWRMAGGAMKKVNGRDWTSWELGSVAIGINVGFFGGFTGCMHNVIQDGAEAWWVLAPFAAPFALSIGMVYAGYWLAYAGQILHDSVKDYSKWARFRLPQFARLPFRLAAAGAMKTAEIFTGRLEAGDEAE